MLEFRKAIHEASHAVVFESLAPGSVRSVDLILNLPQLRYGLTQLQPGSMISADSPEAASIKSRTPWSVHSLAWRAKFTTSAITTLIQSLRTSASPIQTFACSSAGF